MSSVDMKQIDKLTNPSNNNFFNYENKEVIVYIEKIDMTKASHVKTLQELSTKPVRIVTSLEELERVLK